MNIKPTFGEIQPSQQTRIQNISFDEAGIVFDESGYTFNGLSGTYGNAPRGDIIEKKPGGEINQI